MASGLQGYISTALRYSACRKGNMVYILPHSVILLFEVLKSRINTNIKVFMVQETEFVCGLDCVILLDRICYSFYITPVTSFLMYNQRDATLYNILYYCQSSTCFRRFLRPSSGAQKLYTQHVVYVRHACCYR